MKFAAYNELRLLGFSPEEAMELAPTWTVVGMYEQKTARDNGSHTRGKTACVGLKPEFKQLVRRG